MASSRFDDDPAAGEDQLLEDGGATFPTTLETATMVDDDVYDSDDVVPERIGRYTIEERIGRGGMGVVYRARDPQLDRAVALKLLRVRGRDSRRHDRARRRLLREAQALAQLAHPNVVAVHDVGELDGRVFIAMELVDGRSLRDLMRAGELDRHRAVELLLAAGRGLAAAHRAGLIHRDFKPGNVVIGSDGRPRVLDFGLARAHASTDDESLAESSSDRSPEAPAHGLLSTQLTQHGVTLGTPAYMAPEQLSEGRSDERSDQYSFCMTLFEALTGRLPDSEDGAEQRAQQLVDAKLPRWLRAVLARGLSELPGDRYPSMDALLRDLGRDVRARRRAIAIAATVVALGVVATWAFASRPDESAAAARRCIQGDSLRGTWDAAARERVRRAFDATNRAYASDTFARVVAQLDGYAEAWTALRRQTCDAHFRRGHISARLLDLRVACLARRRSALDATVRVLAGPIDDTTLGEAPRAVAGLPALADCADDEALAAAQPLPEQPERRRRVVALDSRLDEADALFRAGQAERGLAVTREVIAQIEPLAHAPLTARAQILRGNLLLELGEQAEADAALRAATIAAAEANDDELEARAWILRMRGLLLQARYEDAARLRDPVEVAVARAGNAPRLRADYAYTLAWMLAMLDDPDAADVQAERSLALWIQAVGPRDPHVAIAHIMSGNTAQLRGATKDAIAHQERAIEILSEALGPTHPDIASASHNLASALLDLGEPHDALAHAERELAISREVFGPDHARTAPALRILGRIHLALGNADRARPLAERALALLDADPDANPSELAYTVRIVADIAARDGRRADAARHYERAIALFSEIFGPDDSTVTEAQAALAEVRASL